MDPQLGPTTAAETTLCQCGADGARKWLPSARAEPERASFICRHCVASEEPRPGVVPTLCWSEEKSGHVVDHRDEVSAQIWPFPSNLRPLVPSIQYSPFAEAHRPRGYHPDGDHEHHQHCARTNGHQCLEYKSRVERDPVQSSN